MSKVSRILIYTHDQYAIWKKKIYVLNITSNTYFINNIYSEYSKVQHWCNQFRFNNPKLCAINNFFYIVCCSKTVVD